MTAIGSIPYLTCENSGGEVAVFDWTGTAWAAVGNPSGVAAISAGTAPSIVDDNGEPAVGYIDGSGGTVRLFNGTNWVTQGGAAPPAARASGRPCSR